MSRLLLFDRKYRVSSQLTNVAKFIILSVSVDTPSLRVAALRLMTCSQARHNSCVLQPVSDFRTFIVNFSVLILTKIID